MDRIKILLSNTLIHKRSFVGVVPSSRFDYSDWG